jgi:hypothetical protein
MLGCELVIHDPMYEVLTNCGFPPLPTVRPNPLFLYRRACSRIFPALRIAVIRIAVIRKGAG